MINNKKKLYVKFRSDRHQSLVDQITEQSKTYTDASKELQKLDVKGIKAEDLTNTDFIEVFHKHHEAEHKKPKWNGLGISYEKYLELRELDTSTLEKLNQVHKRISTRVFELYEFNHTFFIKLENMRLGLPKTSELMKYAPKLTKYSLFDMLSFKGNKVVVDVPKKPFEIYAFNQSQLDLLKDVTEFVDASRKLDLEFADVKPHVKKYVKQPYDKPIGLSYDLKRIDFDIESVLTHRI